jgi:hypothetical protein
VYDQAPSIVLPEICRPCPISSSSPDLSKLIVAGDSWLFAKDIIRLILKVKPLNREFAKAVDRIIDYPLIIGRHVTNVNETVAEKCDGSANVRPTIELVRKTGSHFQSSGLAEEIQTSIRPSLSGLAQHNCVVCNALPEPRLEIRFEVILVQRIQDPVLPECIISNAQPIRMAMFTPYNAVVEVKKLEISFDIVSQNGKAVAVEVVTRTSPKRFLLFGQIRIADKEEF